MTFYLAGPMRGRPHYNFAAFDRARDRLLALGHAVISPADLDRAHGFDALTMTAADDPCDKVPDGFSLRDCVLRDVGAVLDADAVCFIGSGYGASAGSRAEAAVAAWAGKRVFELFEYDTEPREIRLRVVMVNA